MTQSSWNGLYNINWCHGKVEGGFYTVSAAIDAILEEFPAAFEEKLSNSERWNVYESGEAFKAGEKPIAQVTRMNEFPIF